MKSFLSKSVIAFILVILILLSGLFLIPDKKNTVLYAVPDKNKLLEHTPSPRIVFVGGSNLSLGLDSKRISEKFSMPVVNMGIHAGFGLLFILNDVMPYIRKDDLIILVPEYQQYFHPVYYGDITLVSLLVEAYPEGCKHLSTKQFLTLLPNIVKYSGTKWVRFPRNTWEDLSHKAEVDSGYTRFAFNQYGDSEILWNKKYNIPFYPQKLGPEDEINPEMIRDILSFKKSVEEKGGKLLLLPPVYQETSYNNLKPMIEEIKSNPVIQEMNPDFEPSRYMLPDSIFYDTPYHINKQGVDIRTTKVIEDLSKFFEKNNIK